MQREEHSKIIETWRQELNAAIEVEEARLRAECKRETDQVRDKLEYDRAEQLVLVILVAAAVHLFIYFVRGCFSWCTFFLRRKHIEQQNLHRKKHDDGDQQNQNFESNINNNVWPDTENGFGAKPSTNAWTDGVDDNLEPSGTAAHKNLVRRKRGSRRRAVSGGDVVSDDVKENETILDGKSGRRQAKCERRASDGTLEMEHKRKRRRALPPDEKSKNPTDKLPDTYLERRAQDQQDSDGEPDAMFLSRWAPLICPPSRQSRGGKDSRTIANLRKPHKSRSFGLVLLAVTPMFSLY